MTLRLPVPTPGYDPVREAEKNKLIEQADQVNHKRTADLEIVTPQRLILRSPDGTRWKITVDNSGTLSASTL